MRWVSRLSTFWEFPFPFGCWFVVVHVVIVAWDHRTLGYVPRHRLNQSRFQRIRYLCILSCLWREDFEWLGDDWNNQYSSSPIWSDIFPFLSVFTVIRVIFRVVVILGTVFKTSLSSLESWPPRCSVDHQRCELELAKMCPKRRVLLCATWYSKVVLMWEVHYHWHSSAFTLGDRPRCVSKSKLEKKEAYHPSLLWWSCCLVHLHKHLSGLCGWKGTMITVT